MLVVIQRIGEKIFIGDEVVLTILSIQGNYIEFSIEGSCEVLEIETEVLQQE